jgi:cardiolipin synthase
VAVIDGHWATVGSSNIDPFSLLLSREANVVVDDNEFCATLTQSLKRAMESDGQRILKDNWKQQPAYFRFMSWLSYGFVRFMMGLAGYARENSGTRNERTHDHED